jgi:hypothetical protein
LSNGGFHFIDAAKRQNTFTKYVHSFSKVKTTQQITPVARGSTAIFGL